LKLREIAQLCGASQSLGAELAEAEPAGLSIDSRRVSPGDLFIALPGERVDGHEFTREVFDKGACAALVVHKRLPFAAGLGADLGRLLFVENTACALQQLATRVVAGWGRPVVGVTGSAGKTTIKELTAHVLGAAGRVLKSEGNLNTSYGLPLAVGRMITGGARPEDFDLAVLEMGMSSYGEIARLSEIAPPLIGVVGNVGTAHLEFFGTREGVARAKAELIDGIRPGGAAVLNADDPLVIAMRGRRSDIGIVSFGIESAAEVRAEAVAGEDDLSGTRFRLVTPGGAAEVRLPLTGRHNVSNALAAAAVGHYLGLSAEVIGGRLQTASAPSRRGEVLRFANGVTVIDDSYNSNPPALIEAVRAMAGGRIAGRRIVVAGEMLELGARGEELHRECGREIAAAGVDLVIGVRGLARGLAAAAAAAGSAAEFAATPEEAAERLLVAARAGDVILVKGSRGVRTERVVERLREAFGAGGAGGE